MNTPPVPYAPIHLHSYFSLFHGCASPEELCSYARRRELPALGLTDTNNLYGLVRFLNAAEAEGLKPLAGAVLAPEGREICTAYVLNRRGFWRLAELISGLGKTNPGADLLARGWDGLALLSRDPALLSRLRERGGEHLYAKLVYGRSFRPLVLQARRLGIPLCAVNDAYFIEPADRGLCDLLRAMGENRLLEDLPADRKLGPGNRVASGAEMARFFSALPEALLNAWVLSERADSTEILARGRGEGAVFPSFRGQSEADSFRMLKRLCLKGGVGHRRPLPPDLRPRQLRFQHRFLPAGDHPCGPAALQSLFRALSQPGADRSP
jgi:DNA polymerase-3 subunit alpha